MEAHSLLRLYTNNNLKIKKKVHTCSSSVKGTSASGGRGSSCKIGKNSLSRRSEGICKKEKEHSTPCKYFHCRDDVTHTDSKFLFFQLCLHLPSTSSNSYWGWVTLLQIHNPQKKSSYKQGIQSTTHQQGHRHQNSNLHTSAAEIWIKWHFIYCFYLQHIFIARFLINKTATYSTEAVFEISNSNL